MVNFNRQRIAVYGYFLIVFALILGLSFTVNGDRITGNFAFEIINNFANNGNLSFFLSVLSGFLFSLVFSLFIIRHAQEIKKEIKPEKTKFFVLIVSILLAISFISFGLYFENGGDKITGHAIAYFDQNTGITSIDDKPAERMGIDLEVGELYTSNNNIYLVKSDFRTVIGVKQENYGYSWEENGLNYRFQVDENAGILEVRNEQGNWVRPTFDPNLREELKTQAAEEQKQKVVNDIAYQSTWQLLDLTLGKFALGYVEDYCKAQYDSSDYPSRSNNPSSYTNPGNSLAGRSNLQQTAGSCISSQTTVTAQARKSITNMAFTYQTSWTITPCKENVQYNVYLANSVDDRTEITTGMANKGAAKSESKQFSSAKRYQLICVWNSDRAVGNDGYACFNIV